MIEPLGELRIGRTERDRAVHALDEHLSAGRLDADEYGDRAARASLARTQRELDELFVDLPAPHAAPLPAARVPDRAPRMSPQWMAAATIALVLGAFLAVSVTTGHAGGLFPLVVLMLLVLRRGYRSHRRR